MSGTVLDSRPGARIDGDATAACGGNNMAPKREREQHPTVSTQPEFTVYGVDPDDDWTVKHTLRTLLHSAVPFLLQPVERIFEKLNHVIKSGTLVTVK